LGLNYTEAESDTIDAEGDELRARVQITF